MSHASARPANVTAMIGARELHGEILDPSTGNAGQSLDPIGREVPVLLHPDGERFVHVIEGGGGNAPLALPTGWRLESVGLTHDWLLQLPTPTTVFFFPNGDSYQGPLGAVPGSRAFPTPARRFP